MVRSSMSTVVRVKPALLSSEGASVGSAECQSPVARRLLCSARRKRKRGVLIMGETRFAIPPRLSCSANWRDVLKATASVDDGPKGVFSMAKVTHLNSNKLSPPSTAPTNTPSGLRRCLTCVKEPTMSPIQCRPPALTTASTVSRIPANRESWKRCDGDACILSGSTVAGSSQHSGRQRTVFGLYDSMTHTQSPDLDIGLVLNC